MDLLTHVSFLLALVNVTITKYSIMRITRGTRLTTMDDCPLENQFGTAKSSMSSLGQHADNDV